MPTDKELNEERRLRREEQMVACRAEISLGREAATLLSSRLWAENLDPFLRKEAASAGASSFWSPESEARTLDAVALNAAFLGGGVHAISAFRNYLLRMANDGDVAGRKLKHLEELK